MAITLPLDKMTNAEKFEALQLIWEDLLRQDEELPVPDWHEEALREREIAVKQGIDPTLTLNEAKQLLWDRMGWK